MPLAFEPIHPGEVIAEQLEALDLPLAAAARAMGMPQSRLWDIVHGRRGITADTALRLARWLKTDEEFWLNLQIRYDLDVARNRSGAEIAATVHPIAS